MGVWDGYITVPFFVGQRYWQCWNLELFWRWVVSTVRHRGIFIQCPSHKKTSKLFCWRLLSAFATRHLQALSKNRDTENFTTAVFEMEISALHSDTLTIIIIIFINCNWVVTRWQWLFYMYTNMEKKVTRKFKSGGLHERHVVATWKLGNHLSIRL